MLTKLFLAVWRMSVYGAATALVAAAAVLLLRRLRVGRAVCCALWLAVLARLLCPVSLPSPLSIFNAPALGRCTRAMQGNAASLWQPAAPDPDMGTARPGAPDVLPKGAAPASPVQPAGSSPAEGALSASDGSAGGLPAATGGRFAALPFFAGIWLAGTAAMALYGLFGAARLRRRVALACRVEGEPGVFASEQVAEPFAFGILRPHIYLPLGLEREEMRIILLHERAHLRRRDNLVKPLFYAALCLHWFNPLAWLAFKGMACDMEAACDEAVLRAEGSGVKAAYCESLLKFSGPQKRVITALSFGEGRVSGRVRAILCYRRPGFWPALAAALAAACLAAACMADPAGTASAASGAAGSVTAGSTPAQSTPAASTPAESSPAEAPAGGVPAQSGAAASLPAMEGEELPQIYSSDGSLLWPVPQYTSWQEENPSTSGFSSRICAPAGSLMLAMADGRITEAAPPSAAEDGSPRTGQIGLFFPEGVGTQGSVLQSVQYVGSFTPLVEPGDEVSQGQVIAAMVPCDDPDGPSCVLFRYGIDLLHALSEQFPQLEQPGLMAELLPAPRHAPADEDPGRLVWPVPEYKLVSRWMGESHKGADLVAEGGTPILATADGTVTTATFHYSYGYVVVLDHGNGWRSLYAHCSELLVKAGDTVKQGEEIARVGSTGNTTGSQCHFELYRGGELVSARDYFSTAENGGPVPDYEPQG